MIDEIKNNNNNYESHVQDTEFNPAVVEEEDKINYNVQIAHLKELILQKDEYIQKLEKEMQSQNKQHTEHKSDDFTADIKSKDNSINNIIGDENKLREKLEKCKSRLKQYKQETESSLQQVY